MFFTLFQGIEGLTIYCSSEIQGFFSPLTVNKEKRDAPRKNIIEISKQK